MHRAIEAFHAYDFLRESFYRESFGIFSVLWECVWDKGLGWGKIGEGQGGGEDTGRGRGRGLGFVEENEWFW